MQDDDLELINYFENRHLPKPPFRLSASEIINDLPGYIAVQFSHLRSGMSAGSARDKLKRLKERLEEQQNNQLT
ncbi:DUF6965 family protein [Spirosoma endbachense]|uniref:DUF6965 domain-containing protein n=1 Tax=Spirosoma endbachense TaxID=2666025 RepID=A0A6P1VWS4_9BACT|nr:hypothetical protein [Spirosoma endbachense]QHV96237.1 hypothetical protein GJR95_14990 [Spirosoma endbachense]